MTEKRKITAEDLYNLTLITESQISPNGQFIAFIQQWVEPETQKKYANIWLVSTTDEGRAVQFTRGKHVDHHLAWSPDSQFLAFVSNRQRNNNGDEKQAQIYLIPLNGGEARRLTDIKGSIRKLVWLPDGQALLANVRPKAEADLAREADPDQKKLGVVARHITKIDYKNDGQGFLPETFWQIWRVDIDSGQTDALTDWGYHVNDMNLSPNGREIVFWTNRTEDPGLTWDQMELLVLSLQDRNDNNSESDSDNEGLRGLDLPSGPKSHPSFSPDGQWIAYLSQGGHRNRWQHNMLWVVAADGRSPARNLTGAFDFHAANITLGDTGGGTAEAPIWSADSQRLYFQVSQHGRTMVKSINLAGEDLQDVITGFGMVNQFSLDKSGQNLSYLWRTMRDPGQVWRMDLAGGQAHQRTELNQTLLDEIDLGHVEEVWFKGEDGNDLQGWILTPPDFDPTQKYPSIMEIHGGPLAQYGYTFMYEFYYLAAQGYVVYYANPRGGFGYGTAHAKAIYNAWGTCDYDDLIAWNDYIQAKPYIDPARMGVTGGSYGGYMTNWLIARTDRFKAAVTQRCVSNMISMMGSSDLALRFQALFGGVSMPWEDLEHYWKLSPISRISQVKTPTMVIHSENDLRCAIEQGEQVFTALKYLGVPTEMVRFPEESHGLSRDGRLDRRILRLNHILRWFETYL